MVTIGLECRVSVYCRFDTAYTHNSSRVLRNRFKGAIVQSFYRLCNGYKMANG